MGRPRRGWWVPWCGMDVPAAGRSSLGRIGRDILGRRGSLEEPRLLLVLAGVGFPVAALFLLRPCTCFK